MHSAAFVLLQLRVGQQPARLLDETLPPRFGLLGQETTGPGGFGKALRTVPVVRAIAEQVSLHTGDGAVHYVNVRNDGIIAGLGPDAVVEVPARVDRNGAHALPVNALPPEMLTLVQSVTAYEALTLDAARTGDRRTAVRALVAHPLVREPELAADYVGTLLDADRAHLPAFGGGLSSPSH